MEFIRQLDSKTLYISVPLYRAPKMLLLYSFTFFLFFLVPETSMYTSGQPALAMLLPVPALLLMLVPLDIYFRWWWGQVVIKDRDCVTVKRKILGFIPWKRSFCKDSSFVGYTIKHYVVYRIGEAPVNPPVHGGYTVMPVFKPRKLFWFIENNPPRINIGGLLTREEAQTVKKWLEEGVACLKSHSPIKKNDRK